MSISGHMFYGNIFQVTSGYYNFISVQSRNLFHQYLREFVAERPFLGGRGARADHGVRRFTIKVGPANFMVRGPSSRIRAHSGHLGHAYRQCHRHFPGR